MPTQDFVFKKHYRLYRHLLFWSAWWIFCSLIYAFTPAVASLSLPVRFVSSSIDSTFFLIPHTFFSYTLMYVVVPRLMSKSNNGVTLLMVLGLLFITALLSSIIGMMVLGNIKNFFFPRANFVHYHTLNRSSLFISMMAGLRGGITVGGLAAAIRIMKLLYLKEQRNMQLQQENTQAQLQILKAQVHPHFLFNTLNNIYSHTQNTSHTASRLVLGLSDMLRYMLYEGNQPLVALADEVKLLHDYITLETIRYGNKLDVNFDVAENSNDFKIAPLLLLPFVENSFKHGASQVLDHPWLSLTITFTGNVMYFKLLNGKAEKVNHHPYGGLGIKNIEARLKLLYDGKHQLEIQDDPDVFIVSLQVELEKSMQPARQGKSQLKNVLYE